MTTKATKIKGSKNGAKDISPFETAKAVSQSKGKSKGIDDKDKDKEETEEDDEEDDEEDEDEEDEGVPLSDVDLDAAGDDVDVVPYQKVFKDNHPALTQALSTFALPWTTLPFAAHQSTTSSLDAPIDVDDDLSRELAFYKQALGAAQEVRTKLLAEGVPFGRPSDYFAEMIKDDEHMEKVHFLPPICCLSGMLMVDTESDCGRRGK
jgi:rRNA-processing protein EBP2